MRYKKLITNTLYASIRELFSFLYNLSFNMIDLHTFFLFPQNNPRKNLVIIHILISSVESVRNLIEVVMEFWSVSRDNARFSERFCLVLASWWARHSLGK